MTHKPDDGAPRSRQQTDRELNQEPDGEAGQAAQGGSRSKAATRRIAEAGSSHRGHEGQAASSPPRLLDRVRAAIRLRHYSRRTESAYIGWIRRYIHHHGIRHPDEMGSAEVIDFLSDLAVNGGVSVSTQKQATAALLFLYREVLGRDLEGLNNAVRVRQPQHLPVVLTRDEVRAILSELDGVSAIVAQLLYGGGLRLLECLRLRVKDIDFERRQLTIREPKGMRDRATLLPRAIEAPLRAQLAHARSLYEADYGTRNAGVQLPHALERKYPRAPYEWTWYWAFPSHKLSHDPRSPAVRRHHISESGPQKAIRRAAIRSNIKKRTSPHTLRHYADSRIMPTPWYAVPLRAPARPLADVL